jgi:hypothetical protein
MRIIAKDVKVVVDNVQLVKRIKILNWLSGSSYDKRHMELRKSRVANSGTWFLNSEEFKRWAYGTGPGCLLCIGKRLISF